MKTLKIDREKLEEVTREAVSIMINYEWSGWKIDILINEDGEIYSSGQNTNNVYPHAHVLFSVSNVEYKEDEYSSEEDCISLNTTGYLEWFENDKIGYLRDLQEMYNIEFE